MTKKFAFVSVFCLVLVLSLSGSVHAANYSFSLDREVANVFIDQNGVMSIDYTFDFSNDQGASPIDLIDVGLPNQYYDLNSITATVNGQQITDITKSTYIPIGFTLGLGSDSIQPGQSGRVVTHIGTINRMVYPGQKQDYAGFQFIPNYFDSSIMHGSTDVTVTFHLPPGVTPDEGLYYTPSSNWPGTPTPDAILDENGRVTYTWNTPNANGYTQYAFGGGFPAKYVPAAAIVRPNFSDWWNANSDTIGSVACFGGFGLFFVGIVVLSTVSNNKRKMQYLPPKVSIEGHGIKRGLTAVEASVLMEHPLDKIMTMILFGVIKKNAATVTTKDPLKLEVANPLPDGLNDYEKDFLTAFQSGTKAAQTQKLQEMMVALVKSVTEKMKGFSRRETVAYYEDIINRAWAQVETAGTPDVKGEAYDKYMEWTMMDKNFGSRTRTVFGQGPVYVPVWWGRYDPVYRSSMGSSLPSIGKSPTAGTPSVSMPHLPGSDFAASIANSVSAVSAGVVGDVNNFTSGITNRTNPVPVSTSSGGGGGHSSGGGGHSCACACACAGCACACAGGGR